jgi:rhamnosyltransferase
MSDTPRSGSLNGSNVPTCAVLLAAFNGEKYIADQVDSILSQSSVNAEIYIRVDPSADQTQEVISSMMASNPKVRLVVDDPTAPAGAAQNFYRLILSAELGPHVEFVAFSDQDDVWYPDKLLRGISTLDRAPAEAYSSNVDVWSDEMGTRSRLHKAHPQKKWDHLFSSAGPGCTYILRRRTFDAFREWLSDHQQDVMLVDYHDWLIYAWARENGRSWIIDPNATMSYRQHGANQLGVNRGMAAARRRVSQIRSGWYLDQVRLVSRLVTDEDTPPVQQLIRWTLLDRLRLISQAPHLRRSHADQVGVAVAIAMSPRVPNVAGRELHQVAQDPQPETRE